MRSSRILTTKRPALRAAAKPVLGILMLLVLASPVLACPMCKDSTVDNDKPMAAASAGLDFNRSIYVMLGGFATVLGVTGRVIYKAVKSSA
jgi:hypothetical protein